MEKQNKYLTPDEAAERLQVGAPAVRKWLREGSLVGYQFGNLWRIDETDLENFIKASKKGQ